MNIDTYIPCQALQPYIECFRIIESQESCTNRVLPNTTPVLSLRLQGSICYLHDGSSALAVYALSGLRKTPRLIRYEADTANLLILFRAGGITAFFPMPVHELFNESVSLDYFVPSDVLAQLEEQLGRANNHSACIAAAENFLLQRLHLHQGDDLIIAALQQIQHHQGIYLSGSWPRPYISALTLLKNVSEK